LGERVNQEIKRPEKELISPNDSDVKLRSARNGGVDRSSWTYPSVSTRGVLWFLGVSALVLLWSYWPTLRYLANAWWNEPDYSHGLFVVPIVGYLLWNNKDTKPPFHAGVHVGGLIMLGTVVLLRLLGAFAFIDSIDGWTLPLIAIALAWVVGGKGVVRWALPALIFLFFMIPLPFRIENELSRPLQVVATKATCDIRRHDNPSWRAGVGGRESVFRVEDFFRGFRVGIHLRDALRENDMGGWCDCFGGNSNCFDSQYVSHRHYGVVLSKTLWGVG
jgi:hypothetical protein